MAARYIFSTIRDRCIIVALFSLVLAGILYLPVFFSFFSPALNVYSFVDTINTEAIRQFEREHGARVNVKYYDTVGEMMAEMETRNGHGYDVIIPVDYSVELLRRKGLLQKIDYRLLTHHDCLDQRLKNKYFDPGNYFTLPLSWSVMGIGYNKQLLPDFDKMASWKLVFEPGKLGGYSVGLTDSYLEMILCASVYLFSDVNNIDSRFDKILDLLVRQKPYVQNYTGGNYYYFLASGLVPVLLVEGAVMRTIMETDDRFDFVIPREGSLLTIMNIGISVASKNIDLAHAFVDFMLSKEQGVLMSETGYNPTNTLALEEIKKNYYFNETFLPSDKQFSKLFTTHNNFSMKKFEQMWLKLKLA